MKKIYLFLISFIIFVPLGLISQNPAWGEWENDYYKQKLGFVPKGIENANSINAIIPDYNIPFLGEISGYYLSAIIGIAVIFMVFYSLKKVVNSETK